MKKTFYIETYGCQMNFSDSKIIASVLTDENFIQTTNVEDAGVIFLNTCSIRDNAEQRIYNRLKHLKSLKKKNKGLLIGVLGCMAERVKEKFFEEACIGIGTHNYGVCHGLVGQENPQRK